MRSTKRQWATAIFAALVVAMMLSLVASASAAIIDPSAGVFEENCQGVCHGTIWGPTKMATEINFSHGYHVVYQCSSCHGRTFVHSRNGTIKPTMKLCWSCHGLWHGPQGEMATGNCQGCHKTPRSQMRPVSHTPGWAGKPHVVPGRTQLQTRCMMCHTQAQCETCHRAKGIRWRPVGPWVYNSGDGCLQCHGLSTLRKAVGFVKEGVTAPLEKSFQVNGLDVSSHRNLTCGQCHPDFTYSRREAVQQTTVWSWNAALACQNCHDHDKATAVYIKSVHGQAQLKGSLETATCASCHGSHTIAPLKSAVGKAQMHAAAELVCAKPGCHTKQYVSYDDYYHGAAYKKGATDAPACWDCHGAHDIQKVKNPDSLVSVENIGKTCGRCHKGSGAAFGAQAKELIHQQKTIYNDNVMVRAIAWVRSMLPGGTPVTAPVTTGTGSGETTSAVPVAN